MGKLLILAFGFIIFKIIDVGDDRKNKNVYLTKKKEVFKSPQSFSDEEPFLPDQIHPLCDN